MAAVLAFTVFQLYRQGRIGWCACGLPQVWAGDIWSPHNSQHLFDPYSFTHILHGVLFCGIVTWLLPKLPFAWRLCIAVALEAFWEVIENSKVIILRYREATIGLGYEGDSIVNSMGDILCCVTGFILARYLGFRLSLVLFVVTELALLLWVRDNLTLNVLMLIYPIDALKSWQLVH
jgi:hypothetical protein